MAARDAVARRRAICEDSGHLYDVSRSELDGQGAGLILNLTPRRLSRETNRAADLRRHMRRLHCPVVYVTQWARRQRQEHHPVDGESMVTTARTARRDRRQFERPPRRTSTPGDAPGAASLDPEAR